MYSIIKTPKNITFDMMTYRNSGYSPISLSDAPCSFASSSDGLRFLSCCRDRKHILELFDKVPVTICKYFQKIWNASFSDNTGNGCVHFPSPDKKLRREIIKCLEMPAELIVPGCGPLTAKHLIMSTKPETTECNVSDMLKMFRSNCGRDVSKLLNLLNEADVQSNFVETIVIFIVLFDNTVEQITIE